MIDVVFCLSRWMEMIDLTMPLFSMECRRHNQRSAGRCPRSLFAIMEGSVQFRRCLMMDWTTVRALNFLSITLSSSTSTIKLE
jgi:hypothetical protein